MTVAAGERFLTALGYLPVLAWLFLLFKLKRKSLFAQFHLRQSALLFALYVAGSIVLAISLFFVPDGVVQVGVFVLLFALLVAYAWFAFWGLVKSALGERYRMPGVADLALKLNL